MPGNYFRDLAKARRLRSLIESALEITGDSRLFDHLPNESDILQAIGDSLLKAYAANENLLTLLGNSKRSQPPVQEYRSRYKFRKEE